MNVETAKADRLSRRHREMLCLATVVMTLSCLLEVRPDQRVELSFLRGRPLPETCLSRSVFGVVCPGCGLTRSFVHLAHGNWAASGSSHPLGWLLALSVVLQFPYRFFAIWTGNNSPLGSSAPRLFGTLLIVLLLVNWLMRLIALGLS